MENAKFAISERLFMVGEVRDVTGNLPLTQLPCRLPQPGGDDVDRGNLLQAGWRLVWLEKLGGIWFQAEQE